MKSVPLESIEEYRESSPAVSKNYTPSHFKSGTLNAKPMPKIRHTHPLSHSISINDLSNLNGLEKSHVNKIIVHPQRNSSLDAPILHKPHSLRNKASTPKLKEQSDSFRNIESNELVEKASVNPQARFNSSYTVIKKKSISKLSFKKDKIEGDVF